MKQFRFVLALLLTALSAVGMARAQVALPTASQTLQLSAFGGFSGSYTGLAGGRNAGIVAGVDLGLPPWRTTRPTLEVRGLYPIDKGVIDSQKDILAGVRWDFLLNHRIHPYGDFLFGRGQMNYGSSGYPFGGAVYLLTTTNVYSPGAGFDFRLSDHFWLKADGQYQRWGYAPTPTGTVWAKVGTVGVVYRFPFGLRHKR